jgi:hypothetical protein
MVEAKCKRRFLYETVMVRIRNGVKYGNKNFKINLLY